MPWFGDMDFSSLHPYNKNWKPLMSHKNLHGSVTTTLHFHFTTIQMKLLSPTSVTGIGLICHPAQLSFREGLADPAPLLKEQRGRWSSDSFLWALLFFRLTRTCHFTLKILRHPFLLFPIWKSEQ